MDGKQAGEVDSGCTYLSIINVACIKGGERVVLSIKAKTPTTPFFSFFLSLSLSHSLFSIHPLPPPGYHRPRGAVGFSDL